MSTSYPFGGAARLMHRSRNIQNARAGPGSIYAAAPDPNSAPNRRAAGATSKVATPTAGAPREEDANRKKVYIKILR